MERKLLLTECPDATGLIAKITNVCFNQQLNIISNREFVDHSSGRFYMRTELEGVFNDAQLLAALDTVLPKASCRELVGSRRKKMVVLVTKEAHCLGDLLMKTYDGSLDIEIAAVIGNYPDLAPLTEKFAVPFHWVSHEGMSREAHEALILAQAAVYQPNYLVLAKFMRILTPAFIQTYPHRIINIHHSFLPAFIGANPYRQAFERGVKIIGATAHFVTDNLDEGPIIKQQVIPVDHNFTAADMAKAGRDVEKLVLSKALGLVAEDRIFVSGNRTVIL
ncbi:formyltetrahydrofolate deformylase [Shewanella sp. NFH-SH190041]|uniref:formyltetrahydrofolate deformylase n=1 Tax=Shewanella sp. NFH-SH190041 TaxID=2950245 RepID=UPI0021C42AF5|nr:formyltetrahydrofolate deformylase [Shewanella sp. NFH-SH190041]BDM64634.1 formyltetrahydrofolate deformylase [Shewanella sp. NFH-SH190041]